MRRKIKMYVFLFGSASSCRSQGGLSRIPGSHSTASPVLAEFPTGGFLRSSLPVEQSGNAPFTVAHPPIVETDSLVMLAVVWGCLAAGTLGIPCGFLLASSSQNGRKNPPLPLRRVFQCLGQLVLVVAVCAAASGVIGFVAFKAQLFSLAGTASNTLPTNIHGRFLAVQWSHGGAYAAAVLGAGLTVVRIHRLRRRAGFLNHQK